MEQLCHGVQQGGHPVHFQERDGDKGLKVQIPQSRKETRQRGIQSGRLEV